MSGHAPDPAVKPSTAPSGKIDALCDRFEAAWKASSEPASREFLREAEGPAAANWRKDLLAEHLIRAGKLTKFQLRAVLAGKSKKLVLGEYMILDKIGAGGMGQVFKARHRAMKRVVALKVLSPRLVDSPAAVKRFRHEVEAAARLVHPNVVMAYDAGEHDGTHYLVMEYVAGQDLATIVKKGGRLPVPVAVGYVLQAARGLQYAHEQGIIHRDIKPANLLVAISNPQSASSHERSAVSPGGATAAGKATTPKHGPTPERQETMRQAELPALPTRPRTKPQRRLPLTKQQKLYAAITAAAALVALVVLGVVISVRTPRGTIVVQVNEPDAQVSVDDGKVTLKADVATAEAQRGAVEPLPPPDPGAWKAILPADAPAAAIAPFDAATAKKHQEAWAKYLGVPVEQDLDLPGGEKLTMVLIPPGEFIMGSTAEGQARFLEEAKAAGDQWNIDRIPNEGPQHRVRITQPFYLGKYEVTQSQWEPVMGSNSSHFQDDPSHPVEEVSWDDLQAFLAKLNVAGTRRVPSANARLKASEVTFTLPTEAQWEYACRAGTTTSWHCGQSETELQEYAWFGAGADLGGQTHPVGQLRPDGFGLHDMHGNVWEWCADSWATDYYAQSPIDDPSGPTTASGRVFRARRGQTRRRGGSDDHVLGQGSLGQPDWRPSSPVSVACPRAWRSITGLGKAISSRNHRRVDGAVRK